MANQFPDRDWELAGANGKIETWEMVSIAVLMDIRRELRTLNRLLACPNFTGMPATLTAIQRNTARRRKKR